MAQTRVEVERRGAAVWLTLRGGDGHWLTEDTLARLAGLFTDVADDPAVRVAVLRGAAGVFCTGWDEQSIRPLAETPEGTRRLSTLFQQIAETPLPVIAAVEGAATGAGLELAMVCDLRLAADDARFGFPESGSGVLPLGGGASRLARLAGRGMALRLLLTGETIGAGEALACGLVSAVCAAADLPAEVERLTGAIASRGPIAVRYAKEAVHRGAEMPLEQALRFETDLTIILQSTADRAEGVRAFAEKRPPNFGGS